MPAKSRWLLKIPEILESVVADRRPGCGPSSVRVLVRNRAAARHRSDAEIWRLPGCGFALERQVHVPDCFRSARARAARPSGSSAMHNGTPASETLVLLPYSAYTFEPRLLC